ncbi:vomeronasal type-2 receptor 26-like [Tiliqua scincoides]|uniref:vomeronasal type-2 receptor 26-like n=1 Tax=Tiliqua scincoides TaxID=71010 RepID=UPI003461BCAE
MAGSHACKLAERPLSARTSESALMVAAEKYGHICEGRGRNRGREEDANAECRFRTNSPGYFYKPGDAAIGGVVSLIRAVITEPLFREPPERRCGTFNIVFKNYQHALSFMFAIRDINEDSKLLPNVTLGFHLYDNQFDSMITYKDILDVLFTQQSTLPNYQCNMKKQVLSVLGGLTVEDSIQMSTILSIYQVPQLAYSAYQIRMSGKANLPSFYQMAPKEITLHTGIVQLLLHFQWTWIGLIVSDDNNGESFVKMLTPKLAQSDICVAFLERSLAMNHRYLLDDRGTYSKIYFLLRTTDANVIVVSGDAHSLETLAMVLNANEFHIKAQIGKVWIIPPQWDFTNTFNQDSFSTQTLHGALSFSVHTYSVPTFRDFLQTLRPDKSLMQFFSVFWQTAFYCRLPNENYQYCTYCEICRGDEKLGRLPTSRFEMDMTGESYNIYNAVYAVAHTLHAIQLSRQRRTLDRDKFVNLNVHPWQFHSILKSVHFNNGVGHEVLFENGELSSGYDIINWVTFPNQSVLKSQVGEISSNQEFFIHADKIVWNSKFKKILPSSRCVKPCQLGHSKTVKEGKPVCCYDCSQCPGDMISDQMVFFAVVTVLVIQTFLKNWNTPVVKANNRNITCILLSSILLCYFSSLLFFGKPGKVSCLLRQTAFSIIFSVAISSVLAKTIIVILAFLATEPGNKMRKWLGQKVANSIVLSCSLIQVCICLAWLLTTPPFPDVDMLSQVGNIILKCNEGSLSMFYSVLGYMGFLAIVSFTVAFLARKLPDTFNEAKFITFSMLVFCSV